MQYIGKLLSAQLAKLFQEKTGGRLVYLFIELMQFNDGSNWFPMDEAVIVECPVVIARGKYTDDGTYVICTEGYYNNIFISFQQELEVHLEASEVSNPIRLKGNHYLMMNGQAVQVFEQVESVSFSLALPKPAPVQIQVPVRI